MANIPTIEVIDEHTIKVHLPDSMKVSPGNPVPPELFEIIANMLQMSGSIGDEAGCLVQFN